MPTCAHYSMISPFDSNKISGSDVARLLQVLQPPGTNGAYSHNETRVHRTLRRMERAAGH